MSLEIIRNDISRVSADAIVNTANPRVAIGYGVDSAIYEAAGKEKLLEERAKIGEMKPGEAAYTPAFDLDAKYIIHTIGPVWMGGVSGEAEILAQCYRKSLSIAKDLDCESVAFPLMSAGAYGFPKDVALKTAISEISQFLFNNEMTVYLVVYDKESFEVSGKAFNDIKSFIEEEDVADYTRHRRRRDARRRRALADYMSNMAEEARLDMSNMPEEARLDWSNMPEDDRLDEDMTVCATRPVDEIGTTQEKLEDILRDKGPTFQEHLFRMIDRKGLDDKEVYKKANIDRKHFSKIKSNVNYHPSKKTAVAFAIALGLNLDETRDLLLKAGMALTRSSGFDIIIEYCIEHEIRDIYEINCILFEYDQPMLGA